jgi:hypothetical protein
MDNTHQCRSSVDGCTASDPFNLHTYGLIERLMWIGYKAADFNGLANMPTTDFDDDFKTATGTTLGQPRVLYWVIQSGKAKDEADVSNVLMQKISPCLSGGSADHTKCTYSSGNETLYSGFFVIKAEDRVDKDGVDIMDYIDFFNNFNNHYSPTSKEINPGRGYSIPDNRKIAAYLLKETLSSSQVTTRYALTVRPLIGVMDSSTKNEIQVQVLNQALWHPDHRIVLSAAQVQATVNTSCYTVLTEPHFDVTTTGYLYTIPMRSFVSSGGNFFAQCHGVETYENRYPKDGTSPPSGTNIEPGSYYADGDGLFMSKGGLSKVDLSSSNADNYFNADLAIAQFHGPGQLDQGGSLQGMLVDYDEAPLAGGELCSFFLFSFLFCFLLFSSFLQAIRLLTLTEVTGSGSVTELWSKKILTKRAAGRKEKEPISEADIGEVEERNTFLMSPRFWKPDTTSFTWEATHMLIWIRI